MKSGTKIILAAVCGSLFFGGEAMAQEGEKRRQPAGVITLAEITITGRVQKPIAAVDVARIRPKLTLSELRQPFVERISNSIYDDPF